MGEMPRKDYGADAIVPHNNEVVKLMNNINTPYSVQASGAGRSGHYVPSEDLSFATVKTNMRVLVGNQEGYVKSVTSTGIAPDQVLTGVTMGFISNGQETEQVRTLAQLKASSTYFFIRNDEN